MTLGLVVRLVFPQNDFFQAQAHLHFFLYFFFFLTLFRFDLAEQFFLFFPPIRPTFSLSQIGGASQPFGVKAPSLFNSAGMLVGRGSRRLEKYKALQQLVQPNWGLVWLPRLPPHRHVPARVAWRQQGYEGSLLQWLEVENPSNRDRYGFLRVRPIRISSFPFHLFPHHDGIYQTVLQCFYFFELQLFFFSASTRSIVPVAYTGESFFTFRRSGSVQQDWEVCWLGLWRLGGNAAWRECGSSQQHWDAD